MLAFHHKYSDFSAIFSELISFFASTAAFFCKFSVFFYISQLHTQNGLKWAKKQPESLAENPAEGILKILYGY